MRELFDQRSVKRATLTIAITALVSQLFGMVREAVLAGYFGTSAEYDLILLAMTLPGFIASIFYVTIPSTGIPSLASHLSVPPTTALRRNQPAERGGGILGVRSAMTGSFAYRNLLLLGSVAVLLFLLMPVLARLVHAGADATSHDRFVLYGRLFCLLIPIRGVEAIFKTFLHIDRKFLLVTAAPILFSMTFICAIPILYPHWEAESYLPVMLGASLVQLALVSIPFLISRADRGESGETSVLSRDYLGFLAAVTAIESIGALAEPMDRYLAGAYLGDGYISAVNYANITFYSPVRIFIYSLSAAIFPKLAELAALGDMARLRALYRRTIAGLLFLVIPATLYLFLFRSEIVTLLFARGKFDATSHRMTVDLLQYYIWAIPPFALFLLQSRFLFALKAWRTQAIVRVGAIAVKLLLGILLIADSWTLAMGGGTIALSLILATGYHFSLDRHLGHEPRAGQSPQLLGNAFLGSCLLMISIAIPYLLFDWVFPGFPGSLRLILVGLTFALVAFLCDHRFRIVGTMPARQ